MAEEHFPAGCRAQVIWAFEYPEGLDDKGRPKMIPVDLGSVGGSAGGLEVWFVPVIPTRTSAPAPVLYARRLRVGEVHADDRQRGVIHYETCTDRRRSR
jgi:hypothetical protein